MAIDSANKRRSVQGYAPAAIIAPVPDGTIGAEDRAAMVWLFSRDITGFSPTADADAVYNWAGIRDFLVALKTQRVDIIGIGDSNQLFGGTGWNHGFQYVLDQRYTMYATSLFCHNENNNSGFGSTFKGNIMPNRIGDVSGAPASLEAFLDRSLGKVHEYGHLTDGESFDGAAGLKLDADHPVIVDDDDVRADFHYGTFESGSGSFTPGARKAGDGFGTLKTGSTIDPVTGSFGLSKTSFTLSGGDRSVGVQFGWDLPQFANVEGPIFTTYQRVVNTTQTTGWSYHTQHYASRSLRDIAKLYQDASTDYLDYFFEQVRAEQVAEGQTPKVLVIINSGLNDRNETQTSVGPDEVADGDSEDAYADNAQAIINLFKTRWAANGWDTGELYFLIMPSHPISEPDDTELQSYQDAARTVANDNDQTTAVDLSKIVTSGQIDVNGWYSSGGRSHLTEEGYEQLADLAVESLLTGATGPFWVDAAQVYVDGAVAGEVEVAGPVAGEVNVNGAVAAQVR